MNKIISTSLILFSSVNLFAQFPGPVGTIGSTAIHKDSSIFIAWATGCSIQRGYQDISNTSLGFASVGDSTMALGQAGSNGVVSLGDGGSAILTFQNPISNGTGFDFAIFENSFNDVFLELAFVEVSSDGVNYFRFPATSNTQTNTQIGPFDNTGDATKINNLAGKYRAQYGTPFDLQELAGNPLLNINAITHIKIIDVVGSINPLYATYDINNNPINDPFPTAFASGGFDLDAVGVIHQQTTSVNDQSISTFNFQVFPNPVVHNQQLNIQCEEKINAIFIYNYQGEIIYQGRETTPLNIQLKQGVYFIKIETDKGVSIKKIIAQ
jgi:hypothetical protein